MKLFNRQPAQRLYWKTPPADILQMPPESTQQSNDPEPAYIAALLAACGVVAQCVSANSSISTISYHMKLADLRQFGKAKNSVAAISARLGRQAAFSIEGQADFSIVLGRAERRVLAFKSALLTNPFASMASGTACILGADTSNRVIAVDVSSLPHLLVAGSTGSGKSVLLHTIICSMLFKSTPSSVNFIMVDVKMVELPQYNGIPHLRRSVITDAQEAVNALALACQEMDSRYAQMARNPGVVFPRLVIVVDEMADLMALSKKCVENSIIRLAQKSRAANIHMILSTQSPRASVLTGLIRSNIPARVGLKTSTALDSRICIERNGCETLSGKGDAYFIDPASGGALQRFQAAYVSPYDVRQISGYWRSSDCKTTIA